MEFHNSNEKGARIKSHAPGPESIRLLTSSCQEEVLEEVPVGIES
ncbi:hypothetical protein CES85_1736 [Ochrobactrum quorumnocens]|uniref:Uncharacterized protein n=1 Tax=Ochrobactrum quorumnocens TaxID=271865 RepID=A0A248UJF5_9HYPH|nr:hypothetical protein CES85_1736 [[Ochrobactrum] quorumnocens]